MVRQGDFELRLVQGDGQPFPEVQHKGKAIAVAAPGREFEVQVIRHAAAYPAPQPHGSFLNAQLTIDGQCVGYTMNLRSQPGGAVSNKFDGFLKAGDAEGIAKQGFVFAKPEETEGRQVTNLNFEEGCIKCKVSYAEYTNEVDTRRHLGQADGNASIPKLPEGKKFFMAPSLTTSKGPLKLSAGFSTRVMRTLPGGPIAALELRYETAFTLLLRGVLQQSNPAHRAILQMFPETAETEEEQEGEQDENRAGPSNRGAAAAVAGGRKRQRQQAAVKQEREQFVDLTQAVDKRDEVLAAKRADKVLQCDLTAEEEPEWRAVKKTVHSVA